MIAASIIFLAIFSLSPLIYNSENSISKNEERSYTSAPTLKDKKSNLDANKKHTNTAPPSHERITPNASSNNNENIQEEDSMLPDAPQPSLDTTNQEDI